MRIFLSFLLSGYSLAFLPSISDACMEPLLCAIQCLKILCWVDRLCIAPAQGAPFPLWYTDAVCMAYETIPSSICSTFFLPHVQFLMYDICEFVLKTHFLWSLNLLVSYLLQYLPLAILHLKLSVCSQLDSSYLL